MYPKSVQISPQLVWVVRIFGVLLLWVMKPHIFTCISGWNINGTLYCHVSGYSRNGEGTASYSCYLATHFMQVATQPHHAGCCHTTYDCYLVTHFMPVATQPEHAGCCHAACNVPFLTWSHYKGQLLCNLCQVVHHPALSCYAAYFMQLATPLYHAGYCHMAYSMQLAKDSQPADCFHVAYFI